MGIASRTSIGKTRDAPIRIGAEFLRRRAEAPPTGAMWDFAQAEQASPSPPPVDWNEDDVKRAIEAAKQAGLERYRVEIGADGTISIIVGDT